MAQLTIREVNSKLDAIIPIAQEAYKTLKVSNGEPSVIEKLRNIETKIDEDRAGRKEEKQERQFYFRLIIGAVMTNVISLVFAAFVWFVKIYPVIVELQK